MLLVAVVFGDAPGMILANLGLAWNAISWHRFALGRGLLIPNVHTHLWRNTVVREDGALQSENHFDQSRYTIRLINLMVKQGLDITSKDKPVGASIKVSLRFLR